MSIADNGRQVNSNDLSPVCYNVCMKITILTIAPEEFSGFCQAHIIKRAIEIGALELSVEDIRDHAEGSFRHVDDSPYGGGGGMILKCEPVWKCLEAVKQRSGGNCLTLALTPKGEVFDQKKARDLAAVEHLILICGHFEGMDERILHFCDGEISIGDYILTGGELAAQVVANAVTRLLPGVLKTGRAEDESFSNDLLEYPQYTKPADFRGDRVPEVLLSGNHEEIRKWRESEAMKVTKERRPELL